MRALLIITYCILSTSGRLIEKKTKRNDNSEPTESSQPVSISRQVFYDDGFRISREDNIQLEDYVRKGRNSIRPSNDGGNAMSNNNKFTRDSGEKRLDAKKQPTLPLEQAKTSKVLIKKPLPKFNDIDYDDFQVKVSRLPVKFADSGEHEDEDFNLDDYEFDVGHDEFIGRGKPLEPRGKSKENKTEKKIIKEKLKITTSEPPPEIKTQSKVVIPAVPPSNVKRNILFTKNGDKMKEDYYDDITTTTKAAETETKTELDDVSDENDDSKEYTRKGATGI